MNKFGPTLSAAWTAIFHRASGPETNNSWTKKPRVVKSPPPMSPALRVRKCFVLAGLLWAFPALIFGQPLVPQGGEFPVLGEVIGDQTSPSVAISSAGGWVAWQANGIDRKGLGIGVRRLDGNLNPSGAMLPANRLIVGDQEKPAVALLNDGGAVITWQGGVHGFQNIYARFLRADGTFTTDDVLVSQPNIATVSRTTTNLLVYRSNSLRLRKLRLKEKINIKHERTANSSVTKLSDGTVVVAYTSSRKVSKSTPVVVVTVKDRPGHVSLTNSVINYVPFDSDSWQDIYFQRFSPTGQKIGVEVMANQFVNFNQRGASVSALTDGGFVIVWISEEQRAEASVDLMARRFGSDGSPLGDEFRVSTSDLPGNAAAVTGTPDGGFTVVWAQKDVVRTNSLDIHARAFNAAGTPLAAPFLVNAHQYGDQYAPRIASGPGGQLVVWTSLAQDGSRDGVYGRWLNAGAVVGDEFRVNTTTHLRQFTPAVATDRGNRALVIWSSYQTTAGFDLFGQRYAAP